MRTRVELMLVGGLLAPLLGACADGVDDSATPNVVVVLIDTLRPDHLELYGYERETAPFVNQLGAESAVFTQAFSTSGWTAPATASLFTGQYPSTHGVIHGFEIRKKRVQRDARQHITVHPLPTDRMLLTERFREAGYATFGIATNVNIRNEMGFDRGFDRFAHLNGADVDEVADVLSSWSGQIEASQPYFVYLHLMDVHQPTEAREPWFDESETRGDGVIARYNSEIGFVDDWLSRLYNKYGWDSNTVFCLVSDHGEGFNEHGVAGHGPSLHTEVNRVLFMLRAGGVEPAVRNDNVSLVDIAPTLFDLLGVPGLEAGEGRSLLPLLADAGGGDVAQSFRDRPVLAHRRSRELDKHLWMVVRGDWKLIEDQSLGTLHLYNIADDFAEVNDLAEAEPERVAELQAYLHEVKARGIQVPAGPVDVPEDDSLRETLEALGYVHDADE